MKEYIEKKAFVAELKERQDAAKEWLKEAKEWLKEEEDQETRVRADAVLCFIREVKLTLEKITSVDAKPVVKGEWITHYCAANGHSDIYCSVCNKDATYFVGSSDEIHWSDEYPAYCPNCGADMRKEQG